MIEFFDRQAYLGRAGRQTDCDRILQEIVQTMANCICGFAAFSWADGQGITRIRCIDDFECNLIGRDRNRNRYLQNSIRIARFYEYT